MTPVVFRMWADTGEVVALFPTLPANIERDCSSYMHIGQHGAAQYDFVIKTTKPASDYAALYSELTEVGYDDLKVYSRAQPWMHEARKSSPLV